MHRDVNFIYYSKTWSVRAEVNVKNHRHRKIIINLNASHDFAASIMLQDAFFHKPLQRIGDLHDLDSTTDSASQYVSLDRIRTGW